MENLIDNKSNRKERKKEIANLVWWGETLKLIWERSIGQSIELDKRLERNDKFAVCFWLEKLDKLSDLQIQSSCEEEKGS